MMAICRGKVQFEQMECFDGMINLGSAATNKDLFFVRVFLLIKKS
jgi:hypothetical protein